MNGQTRYKEVKLVPCWYFRSDDQNIGNSSGDYYAFIVNAITGESYTCRG